MKRCSFCQKEKEENEFNKDSRAKDGLQLRCRECFILWRKNARDKQIVLIERINEVDYKKCKKCHVLTPLNTFKTHAKSIDGYVSICNSCLSKGTAYNPKIQHSYSETGEELKTCTWCKQGLPLISFSFCKRSSDRLFCHCKTCKALKDKEGFQKYRNRRLTLSKKWVETHRDLHRQYRKTSYQNNLEENRRKAREYSSIKNKTVRGNLRNRISSGMRKSLARTRILKNRSSWESILGYSSSHLIRRLQTTIPVGYNWNNLFQTKDPNKLTIDHIVAERLWVFETVNDLGFKMCWDLENLRLIPSIENSYKNIKPDALFENTLNILSSKFSCNARDFIDFSLIPQEEFKHRTEYTV